MDFAIRAAQIAEAPAIAKLNEIVQGLHYRERPDWFKSPDAHSFQPAVEEWLRSPTVRLFVAAAGADLIGYSVGVQHDRPDTALKHGMSIVELDHVVVVPAARKKGVGRALCDAVIEWAAEQGASRVELGTWAFNDIAYRVFEDLGFTPTIRRMSLTLRDPDDPDQI